MYGLIWRLLPGRRVGKAVTAFVLLLAVLALLFGVVFPLVEPHLGLNDVTVDH